MSLQSLRSMFEHLNDVKNWTLEVVQINASKKNGTSYVGREIIFEPQNKLNEFISEIAEYYVGNKGSFDNKYIDLVTIYKDDNHNTKVLYDKNTKVMYFVKWSGYQFGITPIYNSDGTVKLYDGE